MTDTFQSIGCLAEQIIEDLHRKRTVIDISARQQAIKASASARKLTLIDTTQSLREYVRDSTMADEAVIGAGKNYSG